MRYVGCHGGDRVAKYIVASSLYDTLSQGRDHLNILNVLDMVFSSGSDSKGGMRTPILLELRQGDTPLHTTRSPWFGHGHPRSSVDVAMYMYPTRLGEVFTLVINSFFST
jgi:hypothetical protein